MIITYFYNLTRDDLLLELEKKYYRIIDHSEPLMRN